MSALDDLASFVARYCKSCAATFSAQCLRGVRAIMTADVLPSAQDKQAALHGFADRIGATGDPEFKAEWKPPGCH